MLPPIVTATIQAAILSATANVFGQLITIYKEDKSFSLDTVEVLHYIILRFINCPPFVLYQQFLEDTFPSKYEQVVPPKTQKTKDGKKVTPVTRIRTNWTNTGKKWLIDQSIGNVVQAGVFIAIMASLNGASFETVVEALRSGLRPMVEARMAFWPVAALISFTAIPPKHRVMYNNLLGMTWGIFLTIMF